MVVAAPPAPTVTGIVPDALISIFLKPPAPPPPEMFPGPPAGPPPPPPPATIAVLITRVPGCAVIHPDDVLVVVVHFPNEVVFVFPSIPPFAVPPPLGI
jgi:hypothetical protein